MDMNTTEIMLTAIGTAVTVIGSLAAMMKNLMCDTFVIPTWCVTKWKHLKNKDFR